MPTQTQASHKKGPTDRRETPCKLILFYKLNLS